MVAYTLVRYVTSFHDTSTIYLSYKNLLKNKFQKLKRFNHFKATNLNSGIVRVTDQFFMPSSKRKYVSLCHH